MEFHFWSNNKCQLPKCHYVNVLNFCCDTLRFENPCSRSSFWLNFFLKLIFSLFLSLDLFLSKIWLLQICWQWPPNLCFESFLLSNTAIQLSKKTNWVFNWCIKAPLASYKSRIALNSYYHQHSTQYNLNVFQLGKNNM